MKKLLSLLEWVKNLFKRSPVATGESTTNNTSTDTSADNTAELPTVDAETVKHITKTLSAFAEFLKSLLNRNKQDQEVPESTDIVEETADVVMNILRR